MTVHTLITALALDNEDVELTKQCYNSFVNCKTSFVNDVMVDTRLHGKDLALTAKWNEFCNFYRGKDYDYLMLCANDTIAHPQALQYMVDWMEDNLDVDIMHPYLERDRHQFDVRLNEVIEYDSIPVWSPHETANMILRKGVIETVGEFDLLLPHERNEQDYFIRAKKLGKNIKTANMRLFYHPDHSQDDPNRQGLSVADRNFQAKHGCDWFSGIEGEGFEHPFNDPSKNWTDTKQSLTD